MPPWHSCILVRAPASIPSQTWLCNVFLSCLVVQVHWATRWNCFLLICSSSSFLNFLCVLVTTLFLPEFSCLPLPKDRVIKLRMLRVSFRLPLCKPPNYIPSVSHVTLTQGTADEDGTTWAKSPTHSFCLLKSHCNLLLYYSKLAHCCYKQEFKKASVSRKKHFSHPSS